MFVNRNEELKALKKRLESDAFELIVIYGRRRIGKTALILESVKNREYVYYLAVEGDNLNYFKRTVSHLYPNVLNLKDDWEVLLSYLKDKIVIIDEFPNLIIENRFILSLFQRLIDTKLFHTRTKLVLLGSSISMMGERVLAYKSPLYGRKTSVLKLKPIKFMELNNFFPNASMEELVEIYGFTDGVPYYLRKIQYPFWNWLENEIKAPDTFLKYEVDFLMKYEFKEVSTYKKILEAVAYGKRTPKEIRDYLGLRHSDISPYLNNLIETEFLVKKIPITDGPKSRKGRYFLRDNFLSFWFRFIAPNLSAIEQGIFNAEEIREDYSSYLGTVFEKVSLHFVLEMNKRQKLPFQFKKFGQWWHKEDEIDLILLDNKNKNALFLEVKWKQLKDKDIKKTIKDLEQKVEHNDLFRNYKKFFGIVAKKAESKDFDEHLIYDLGDFRQLASNAQ